MTKIEGLHLRLDEWAERLLPDEYEILIRDWDFDRSREYTSQEVCEILIHEDGVFYEFEAFASFVQCVYGIQLV